MLAFLQDVNNCVALDVESSEVLDLKRPQLSQARNRVECHVRD